MILIDFKISLSRETLKADTFTNFRGEDLKTMSLVPDLKTVSLAPLPPCSLL